MINKAEIERLRSKADVVIAARKRYKKLLKLDIDNTPIEDLLLAIADHARANISPFTGEANRLLQMKVEQSTVDDLLCRF